MGGPPQGGAPAYLNRLGLAARASGHPICLDSAPLIDYFTGLDPFPSLLDPLLRDDTIPIVVSTVTLAELITRRARVEDVVGISDVLLTLRSFPNLEMTNLDQRHAIETATVRARTGLKLPDAAIVATARLAEASALLGNDRRWRTVPLGVPYHHLDDIMALP